ncbi:hypothetical protein [Pedobacter sp.]
MTQEIKVNLTLTLEGDTEHSTKDIRNFIADMMINATSTRSFSLQKYAVNRIEEENAIYAPDPRNADGVWDFVEKYYPNYHSCDEIMRNDDLCKIVNQELSGDAAGMFKSEFKSDHDQAVAAFDQSSKYVYERSIIGYLRSQTDRISIVWSLEDIQERAKQGGYILKEGEALKVLELLRERHDCNIGINWDVIDDYIIMTVPKSQNDDGFDWEQVAFDGNSYNCRLVPDLNDRDFQLLVAPVALSVAMRLDRNGNGAPEATLLDERICFYATPLELLLSDRELFDLIYN